MLFKIMKEKEMQKFVKENSNDPWVGTPAEGVCFLSNGKKGAWGEKLFKLLMISKGHIVNDRTNTGNDCKVDNIITEVKTSVPCQDVLTINHIAEGKDWERLVVIGLNPKTKEQNIFWFSKKDFSKSIKNGSKIFNRQQGGSKGGNDDYITNVKKLLQSDFIKDISEW